MHGPLTDDPTEAAWFGREDADEDRVRAAASPEALLAQTEGLRAPPAVAAKILSLGQDPNASFVDLRVALEQDPALCAQLVRIANTAAFATRIRCSSVDDAVMRLGTKRVRAVAAGLVALGAFERETPETSAIRAHSARVGAIAEVLGREWRSANAADMFLCGIVHDLGKLVFAESGTLDYSRAPGGALSDADQSHVWEHAEAGFDHATLGATVLEGWLFPPWITRAVELHHDPAAAFAEGGDLAVSVSILRLADRIEYALRSETPEPWAPIAHGAEASYLAISEDVLAALWPKLSAAVEEVARAVGS